MNRYKVNLKHRYFTNYSGPSHIGKYLTNITLEHIQDELYNVSWEIRKTREGYVTRRDGVTKTKEELLKMVNDSSVYKEICDFLKNKLVTI